MTELLQTLCDKGIIRQLDLQFGRFVESLDCGESSDVAFIAGVLSNELSRGHICISLAKPDFSRLLGLYGRDAEEVNERTGDKDWDAILTQSSVVGNGKENRNQPLIMDRGRLYLQRYWYYEQFLAGKLTELSEPILFSEPEKRTLAKKLNLLFPEDSNKDSEPDWQQVAVAVALSRRLSVISGGPGTGKTTTVVKLLAALIDQGLQKGFSPEIKLVAPTGKAAARLTESVGGAMQSLNLEETTRALMPESASTIHRLLGAIPNRAEFRHNSANPLHLDILVVDEASMVDLPLMAKLTEALPPQARLILLGDKDQLASVEAGAVLGDICSFTDQGYSSKQTELLKQLTGAEPEKLTFNSGNGTTSLSDSLCMLRKSYRFDQNSGIGVLAGLVNKGDFSGVSTCLKSSYADVQYNPLTSETYQQMIQFLADQYAVYLKHIQSMAKEGSESVERDAREALSLFSRCRLLCAVREGEFGLSGLNREIEKLLIKKKLILPGDEAWYSGRPIMITRNDHALGLYNGDIGIAIAVTESDPSGVLKTNLKVFFELPDGSVKSVLPSRIPAHETAYAMTVHKSQGSEFPTTVMILPARYSPVVSRELIYTGITRARQALHIYADARIFKQGVENKTERLSGLRDRLADPLET